MEFRKLGKESFIIENTTEAIGCGGHGGGCSGDGSGTSGCAGAGCSGDGAGSSGDGWGASEDGMGEAQGSNSGGSKSGKGAAMPSSKVRECAVLYFSLPYTLLTSPYLCVIQRDPRVDLDLDLPRVENLLL